MCRSLWDPLGTFTYLFGFYVHVFMLSRLSTRPFCNKYNGFTCVQSTMPRYTGSPNVRLKGWEPQFGELLDTLLRWDMLLVHAQMIRGWVLMFRRLHMGPTVGFVYATDCFEEYNISC